MTRTQWGIAVGSLVIGAAMLVVAYAAGRGFLRDVLVPAGVAVGLALPTLIFNRALSQDLKTSNRRAERARLAAGNALARAETAERELASTLAEQGADMDEAARNVAQDDAALAATAATVTTQENLRALLMRGWDRRVLMPTVRAKTRGTPLYLSIRDAFRVPNALRLRLTYPTGASEGWADHSWQPGEEWNDVLDTLIKGAEDNGDALS